MTKTHKKRTQTEPTPKAAILSALPGLISATVAAVVLILVGGIVALFCPNPGAVARIVGYASLYISSAVGGFFAFRKCCGYTLLCGLYTGLAFLLLTLLLSLLVPSSGNGMGAGLALLLRLPIPAAAVGGAFLGAYRPQKRRHRRKR